MNAFGLLMLYSIIAYCMHSSIT